MILNEQDVVETWLSGSDIEAGIFAEIEPINIYNKWCDMYDMDTSISATEQNNQADYTQTRSDIDNWHMPEEYKQIDLTEYLFERVAEHMQIAPCDFVYSSNAWKRTEYELQLFEQRGMYPVLRFLIYLVDVCDKNDVVLGVGRGSSVASYILYLIGVHKVNSLYYDLDIKEFLK